VLAWLLGAAVGPAAVALPMNWTADALVSAAKRWFKRFRRMDDLSRLVAAAGASIDLTQAEFIAVRRLLEDQRTWTLLGHGTVADLATQIADCLPPQNGRTAEDSHAAGETIARGLIEFAVAGLDPKLFQQVLLVRLQRMESGEASALDEAMFSLHADLIVGFASVMGEFKRVLDRLPPAPAQRGEIVVYLKALIDWLSTDPWPRDRRFNGPALAPAAIERKLRMTAQGNVRTKDLDADGLAKQCQRLVILGGPGSGKTWLAKRTARRCAEDAFEALAAGGSLDEVELPLYTTCSRLLGADGNIREAAVASALNQIGDLGRSQVTAALQTFFPAREAPVVLVIDSLDEAHGSGERLRQADTLPWRIILTSRPSSWNQQLAIEPGSDAHQVGELQPLRYPGDVEPFIERWFGHRPERGKDLAAQIARRPALQQAATVPLILAFYCIVGGSEVLPDFQRDLISKVLNRMLTGRWRNDDDRQPDLQTCLEILRAWAWSGATSHPFSGVGTWTDDILTGRVRLGETDKAALGHVAVAQAPPGLDSGKTLRRFVHRTIREHLVAEYIAGLSTAEAADILLPHLWYDPDWEYTAPAALVMHPQHDHILRELICRAARSNIFPPDISAIDADGEFKRFLTRVVAESSGTRWSAEIAAIIKQAQIDVATSDAIPYTDSAPPAEPSKGQARQNVLQLVGAATESSAVQDLVGVLLDLDPLAEDRLQARQNVLRLLGAATESSAVQDLVGVLLDLDPLAEDRLDASMRVMGLLACETKGSAAEDLAWAVARLDSTAESRSQARRKLLELLASESGGRAARQLGHALIRLKPSAQERRQATERLLGLLATESDRSERWELAELLTRSNLTEHDRQKLLELLASETDSAVATLLVEALTGLAPTAQDLHHARQKLLALLVSETDILHSWGLGDILPRLDPTALDRDEARRKLLEFLHQDIYIEMAEGIAETLFSLAVTTEEARYTRRSLLELLASQASLEMIEIMLGVLVSQTVTAEDQRRLA
jgi:hypothetical protein